MAHHGVPFFFEYSEEMLIWTSAVLCLSFLLPNHYSPWLSFHQEFAAALAFLPLAAWISTQKTVPLPPLAAGVALLSLVPLLQLAFGKLSFATDAWMSSLYLLGFALAVYTGAWCVNQNERHVRKKGWDTNILWQGLLFAALISSGIAMHQWALPDYQGIYVAEIAPGSRPFGNLAQPNQLATLLLVGLAALLQLWSIGKIGRTLAIATAIIVILALVMSGSRSALLALAWIIPAYMLMRNRCSLQISPTSFFLFVAFYLVASFFWPFADNILLLGNEAGSALNRLDKLGIRTTIWLSMLDAVSRSPLTGYGWGQISMAQIGVTLDHHATHSVVESSHNLLLDLALWNGLPLAILITVGLGWWFIKRTKTCRSSETWISLVAIGIVFSHSMVEYPLNYAYFLLPIGFLMGMQTANQPVNSRSPYGWKDIAARTPLRLGIWGSTATAMVATIIIFTEYFYIEEDWALMRFQHEKIGDVKKNKDGESMIILTSLEQFLAFSRLEAKNKMSDEELDFMKRNSQRFAYAAPMFKYALAQALNQRGDEAVTTLRQLCSMHSERACTSARKHWEELASSHHPELASINFPK